MKTEVQYRMTALEAKDDGTINCYVYVVIKDKPADKREGWYMKTYNLPENVKAANEPSSIDNMHKQNGEYGGCQILEDVANRQSPITWEFVKTLPASVQKKAVRKKR